MTPPRRPVLFVTNHVPPDRAGAFRALHDRVPLELALFGGRSTHATAGLEDPGIPFRRIAEAEAHALAASGRFRAVIAGTVGRTALPASWLGARRARVPFVLWSALWSHPRSAAHLAGAALLHAVYRDAHAVVAYGPHVAAFARARGARRVVLAPQAVDQAFWAAPADAPVPRPAAYTAVFVGREAREKGLRVLLEAWRATGFRPPEAALTCVGAGPAALAGARGAPPAGVGAVGPRAPHDVRNFLASADVLVVPSIRTPTFREPWGLVCNEAMHQAVPVIATTEVGAAAGGLVRHERNGLVVPAADPAALSAALARLEGEPALRARLGEAARRDAAAWSFEAWADGFATALDGSEPLC